MFLIIRSFMHNQIIFGTIILQDTIEDYGIFFEVLSSNRFKLLLMFYD